MQLALAYRSSAVLFAAVELGVFTAVADKPLDAADIARACGADRERLHYLLEACVAEGLLSRDGDAYANTSVTDAFLVKGRPAYSANGFKYARGSLSRLESSGGFDAQRPAADAARHDSRRRQGQDPRLRVRHARTRTRHRIGAAAPRRSERPQEAARCRRRPRHVLRRADPADAGTDVHGARRAWGARSRA